MVNEDLHVPLG